MVNISARFANSAIKSSNAPLPYPSLQLHVHPPLHLGDWMAFQHSLAARSRACVWDAGKHNLPPFCVVPLSSPDKRRGQVTISASRCVHVNALKLTLWLAHKYICCKWFEIWRANRTAKVKFFTILTPGFRERGTAQNGWCRRRKSHCSMVVVGGLCGKENQSTPKDAWRRVCYGGNQNQQWRQTVVWMFEHTFEWVSHFWWVCVSERGDTKRLRRKRSGGFWVENCYTHRALMEEPICCWRWCFQHLPFSNRFSTHLQTLFRWRHRSGCKIPVCMYME